MNPISTRIAALAVPPLVAPAALLARRIDPAVGAAASILAVLAVVSAEQALASASFLARALAGIAPALAISVFLAAAAKASGADVLIGQVFVGRQARMIVLAALFGALSPFCSCGVVPLIAGLLAAGVPLAPVMAFWISSPLMDPSQFVLLTAELGLGFALAKLAAAIGLGALSGFATMGLMRLGAAGEALRHAPKRCGKCKSAAAPKAPAPVWRFWEEDARARMFLVEGAASAWFLLRWLALAFVLESLMVAYVPAHAVAHWLGGGDLFAIALAAAIGVPAYLNGFAAIPLVAGLIELGLSPAVGLTFMVAGGITSIPAAIAVYALVKRRVFALYLVYALAGSMLAGYGYLAVLRAA